MEIRKTFIRATLVMTGTIIGAGIFGVPSVIAEAGVLLGSILFWITWGVVLTTHLLFLELIVLLEKKLKKKKSNSKRHRLPGYTAAALGPWAKYVTAATQSLQLIGASFAYLILGGEFFGILLARANITLPPISLQILFWAIGAVSILLALRVMAKVQSFITWALLVVLVILIASAAWVTDLTHVTGMNWDAAFTPIGVFLFSLFGMTIIPEVFEVTGRRIDRTRRAVVAGSFLAALLTWLFGIFIAMAVPVGVAVDRVAMVNLLPSSLWWTLPALGLFAVLTSFIASAFDLRMMYRIELDQPRIVARFVALGIPLLLLFIAPRNFLEALDVVGTFFSGGNALVVVLAAFVFMRSNKVERPFIWKSVMPFVAAGFFVVVMASRLLGLVAS